MGGKFAGFEDSTVTGCNCTEQWKQQQDDRVIPRSDDEDDTFGFFGYGRFVGLEHVRDSRRLGLQPAFEVLQHMEDLIEQHGETHQASGAHGVDGPHS